jgi:hypothetical protein
MLMGNMEVRVVQGHQDDQDPPELVKGQQPSSLVHSMENPSNWKPAAKRKVSGLIINLGPLPA